ncbi:hypothetical protein HID58_014942, partial [Brassica napus]
TPSIRNHQAVRRTRRISRVRTRRPSGRIRMIKPSLSGTIFRHPSRDPFVRLQSETIKQSAEPAKSVASGLAGHQAGSARLSHRSPVPSLDILVAIHSCRDQNQSQQNKEDP